MNWQDYLVIGTVVLNRVSAVRHHKFALAAFQKGLANNRQLLARTLKDIISAVEQEAPAKTAAPVEEAQIVVDPNIAERSMEPHR